jgi:hypothetical protein
MLDFLIVGLWIVGGSVLFAFVMCLPVWFASRQPEKPYGD